ncbi:MAG TPA: amino acid-binding protein [Planctomycetota bacterium]|nr:amino acid-binding protein [Planctomycetota bacterium]
MNLNIARADLWAAPIEDEAGGLARKLEVLKESGANFEFVFARRSPEAPGKGVVFLTPIKGSKQKLVAKTNGFQPLGRIGVVRVEGPNTRGISAKITTSLAGKNLSLRGFSASSVGKRFVMYMAFDSQADATQAVRTLKRKL